MAASSGLYPCASSPQMSPARTSPLPPFARFGAPNGFTYSKVSAPGSGQNPITGKVPFATSTIPGYVSQKHCTAANLLRGSCIWYTGFCMCIVCSYNAANSFGWGVNTSRFFAVRNSSGSRFRGNWNCYWLQRFSAALLILSGNR